MSLQDDVNAEVALVNEKISAASTAAGAVAGLVAAIPDSEAVVLSAIVAGFGAVADAIDALGGNSSGIRTAAGNIENGSVSLVSVKAALTGCAGAITPHTQATSAMAGLLIAGSNYAGLEQ